MDVVTRKSDKPNKEYDAVIENKKTRCDDPNAIIRENSFQFDRTNSLYVNEIFYALAFFTLKFSEILAILIFNK